jgi:hypothetical protein
LSPLLFSVDVMVVVVVVVAVIRDSVFRCLERNSLLSNASKRCNYLFLAAKMYSLHGIYRYIAVSRRKLYKQ